MANITSMIVENVIKSLEKIKSPDNQSNSFWSYLKDQLYSESTWDQNDLAVIEKQIMNELNKLDQKDLTKIWQLSDTAQDKIDDGINVNDDDMKQDLVNDLLGKVLDRMDDNYSSAGFVSYSSGVKKKSNDEDDDSGDDFNEDEIEDENFDDDFFDEDSFEDDEENF